MKLILLLTAYLSILPLFLKSQTPRRHTYLFIAETDSFIRAGCNLRSEIISAITLKDTAFLRKYNKVHLTHETVDRIYLQRPLLTEGESHILSFWLGEYSQIMSDLREGTDYFTELRAEGALFPNFSCGNFGKDLLPYWIEKSQEIKEKINKALITQPEKEALSFYWDMILLSLGEKHELFNSETNRASKLIQLYPDCGCHAFLERMLRTKRRTIDRSIWSGLGYAQGVMVGPIQDYINNRYSLTFNLGIEFKQRWNIQILGLLSSRLTNGEFSIPAIDGQTIVESSGVRMSVISLMLGARILSTKYFNVKAFGSATSGSISNLLDVADSTITTKRSANFYTAGFGLDINIPLYKQKPKRTVKSKPFFRQSYRLDGSFTRNGLELNLNAGYIPTYFNQPTDINGGIAFFAASLKLVIYSNYAKTTYHKWGRISNGRF